MVATAATFFNPLFLHTHGRIKICPLSRISWLSGNGKSKFPIISRSEFDDLGPICATFKEPKGFGPSTKKSKKMKREYKEEEEEEEEGDRGVIPEVVTNRMMSRMAVSVGIPLGIGLLFFPFFYYLKVGLKIDVPTWVPFIVSFFFFGSALLGVSYGIVSSSWDPLREGSFWGWNEAQKNWPVFWQSLRVGSRKN
ncbi:hypothetical protein VNO78_08721 [Psophocarpus tetragonolobus]|uniref:Protein PAM68, chloroplastic n=1 Tax=Psophocarpus tetragonolobus TaxID=3891 RepID=A0AAN9XT59_PSOTE